MKSKRLDWNELNTISRELLDNNDNRNDFMLGLYIAIALRTGLRVNDILNLQRENFNWEKNSFEIITKKTKNETMFFLPDWLMKIICFDPKLRNHECVFYNEKYGGKYSATWVNLRLKKLFGKSGKCGISSHSIRKSAGLFVYEKHGVNGARNFLTHKNITHTSIYLDLDKIERFNMQKKVFFE